MDFCQDALVFLSSAALRVTDDPADPADPAPRLASKTCFLTGTLGVPARTSLLRDLPAARPADMLTCPGRSLLDRESSFVGFMR